MPSRCLSPQQAARFYRIWLALLHYVNEQRHLVAPFSATANEQSIPTADVMQLRDALWADDALREAFIAANPAGLSSEELALVANWQHRLAGSFFIVRALKAYTVFLTEREPAHAYGVLGITSPIEETVELPLPVYTQAVLLPFEEHIIYDSLLKSYTVFFGPNIRHRLADSYRNAKEREGIITSLLPATPASLQEQRAQVEARNAKLIQAFRKHLLSTGLSLKTAEQHASTIETFARTTLLSQDSPRGPLETTPAEIETYLRANNTKTAATSFKRFVRFLAESGRMEYEQAEDLRQAVLHAHA